MADLNLILRNGKPAAVPIVASGDAYIGDLQSDVAELAMELAILKNQSVLELSDGIVINFDDTAGIDTVNSSNYYHNATGEYVTNIDPVTYGNSYWSFDGTNDQLTLGSTISNTTTDRTWTFWYKGTDTAGTTYGTSIIGNDSGGVGAQIVIKDNKLQWKPFSGTAHSSTTSINDNSWHHCAIVYHTGDTVDIYVDAVKEVDAQSTASGGTMATFMHGWQTMYTAGQISDVRLYSAAALTGANISDIYDGTDYTTGLTNQWLPDSNDLTDQVGSNNLTNTESVYSASGGPLDGAGEVTNMTLISEPFVATSAPDDVAFTMRFNEVDAVTLNTDLTVDLSRDDGATWQSTTLTELRTSGTEVVVSGTADLSGQTSDTDIVARIQTPGGTPKEVQIISFAIQVE